MGTRRETGVSIDYRFNLEQLMQQQTLSATLQELQRQMGGDTKPPSAERMLDCIIKRAPDVQLPGTAAGMSSWLTGKFAPLDETAQKLENALGITPALSRFYNGKRTVRADYR
jgi:hypothetical protein